MDLLYFLVSNPNIVFSKGKLFHKLFLILSIDLNIRSTNGTLNNLKSLNFDIVDNIK